MEGPSKLDGAAYFEATSGGKYLSKVKQIVKNGFFK
jgi:hypothetical protein